MAALKRILLLLGVECVNQDDWRMFEAGGLNGGPERRDAEDLATGPVEVKLCSKELTAIDFEPPTIVLGKSKKSEPFTVNASRIQPPESREPSDIAIGYNYPKKIKIQVEPLPTSDFSKPLTIF